MPTVAVTGTRNGAKPAQLTTFEKLMADLDVRTFCHGCCVGVDEQAVMIVRKIGRGAEIRAFPPTANQNLSKPAMEASDRCERARDYLVRDQDMVNACQILVALPKSFKEILRSGTWATVRYARRKGRKVIIIWPDGSTSEEG